MGRVSLCYSIDIRRCATQAPRLAPMSTYRANLLCVGALSSTADPKKASSLEVLGGGFSLTRHISGRRSQSMKPRRLQPRMLDTISNSCATQCIYGRSAPVSSRVGVWTTHLHSPNSSVSFSGPRCGASSTSPIHARQTPRSAVITSPSRPSKRERNENGPPRPSTASSPRPRPAPKPPMYATDGRRVGALVVEEESTDTTTVVEVPLLLVATRFAFEDREEDTVVTGVGKSSIAARLLLPARSAPVENSSGKDGRRADSARLPSFPEEFSPLSDEGPITSPEDSGVRFLTSLMTVELCERLYTCKRPSCLLRSRWTKTSMHRRRPRTGRRPAMQTRLSIPKTPKEEP